MALRAKPPEASQKRLKMLVYGPPGVGKTIAALAFQNAYIIDTEKGTDFYADSINKSGSVVFQSNNSDEIKEELKTLLTTKHPYRVLLIDPITQVYNACQEKWTRIFEKHARTEKEATLQDFGPRYWGRVKSEMKAIDRLMMSLDMSVIITSHQKDIYGPGMQKIGVGPDAMKGSEYLFDYVFELKNIDGKRVAVTIKERSEIGQNKFPPEFEWNYEAFRKFYGAEILEKDSTPVKLAAPEQVAKTLKLLEVVNVSQDEREKWLTKAEVDSFDDMTSDQIGKVIAFLEKKLELVSK